MRGRDARRRAWRQLDTEIRQRESLMFTVLIVASLWAGFWMQYLVGMTVNQPAIHTFSGGHWFEPLPDFYVPANHGLPFSLARSFWLLSLAGALTGVVGVCWLTAGARGRWRMRLAVLGFAAWLVLWSSAALAAGDTARAALDQRHREVRRIWWETTDDATRRWARGQMDEIEAMREKWPDRDP